MKQEYPFIHVIRVTACIMVVMLHSLPPMDEFTLSTSDKEFWYFIYAFTRPCVPLFFMITGFLILPYKGNDFWGFYKKRIFKVLYPLWFWGVLYAILPWLLGIYGLDKMMYELVLSPVRPPELMGGILWYLFILIGIYLFIPFLAPSIYENKYMARVYLSIWLLASILFVIKLKYNEILGETPLHHFDMTLYFSGYLGYMILGMYLKKWRFVQGKVRIPYWGGCFVMYFFMFICAIVIPASSTRFLSIGALILTFCVFVILSQINYANNLYPIIMAISKRSFGIYLSQIAVFRVLTIHVYEYWGTDWYMQLITMMLTLYLSFLLISIFENLPLKKYIIG